MREWLAVLGAIGLSVSALAGPAEDKGLAIAQEVERRDTGWGDVRSELEMVLSNRHGQESRRQLRIQGLEMTDDGDLSLTIFDAPRDIAGTAFLSYTHALTPDDQWLYLPALKRVKRIASANKSGPFVGSEFAYEDLSSQEVQKYRYRWLRDEPLEGRPTHVLEEHPAYEHSGYTRRIVWIDQAMMQPLKVAFHDRKDALLKTLVFEDYAQYLDRYWRPARMTMENHQSGKRTVLHWANYQFRSGLTARDFDQNALKRAR
ncbi:MAG: outer membrane lipoprotein-sorting protein [Gammaproteobacteria bacterium]